MSEQWIDCYQQHLERHIGSASTSRTFQQKAGTSAIEILTYERVFTGCRAFCSLGLTHYRQEVENIAEVILATDDGWDDIPYIFANVLFYIVQAKMQLGWGMVIGGVDTIAPHFARKFGKTALYFTTPESFPQSFRHISCQNQTGKFFQAFFISPEERKFFNQHGADKFETLLEEKGLDPFDLKRPSCI